MATLGKIFDFDPQNKGGDIEKLNAGIRDLEKLFNDPKENGQLFISYPMSEALLCINDAKAGIPLRHSEGWLRREDLPLP